MLYRQLAPRVLALAAAAIAACPLHAEVDALVQQAQKSLEQGQARQAFDLLAPEEVKRAGDPDFDMALGRAANGAGEFTRAIMALERVVANQPTNGQARAELGRAMFAAGDRKSARELLAESKIDGAAFVAGESIDQLLQAVDRVDAEGKSSYRGWVELAGGHDSNVNAGPGVRNLAVPLFGGALTAIQPAGIRTSASYVNAGAGLTGRYIVAPRWSLIGNIFGNVRHHSSAGRPFDYLQVDLNGGVAYRVERNEYTLVAQYGVYDIDSNRVRNSTGAIGEWTYRFDGFRQFSTYLQYGRLSYPQSHVSDADRTVAGMTYAQMWPSGLFAYGGVYAGREEERATGVQHLGHKLWGFRGGVQRALAPALAGFVTFAYEDRDFGGQDPLFLTQRRDKQVNLSLGLSWVPISGWRFTPQVAWTRNESTVPLADYTRRTVSLAARREF